MTTQIERIHHESAHELDREIASGRRAIAVGGLISGVSLYKNIDFGVAAGAGLFGKGVFRASTAWFGSWRASRIHDVRERTSRLIRGIAECAESVGREWSVSFGCYGLAAGNSGTRVYVVGAILATGTGVEEIVRYKRLTRVKNQLSSELKGIALEPLTIPELNLNCTLDGRYVPLSSKFNEHELMQ